MCAHVLTDVRTTCDIWPQCTHMLCDDVRLCVVCGLRGREKKAGELAAASGFDSWRQSNGSQAILKYTSDYSPFMSNSEVVCNFWLLSA